MSRVSPSLVALGFLLITAPYSAAQSTFAQPYSSQLRTDPAVGNVQGIQRYGRQLKTDPDQGSGYSYHVYPVAHPTVVAATPFETPQRSPFVGQSVDSNQPADAGEANQAAGSRSYLAGAVVSTSNPFPLPSGANPLGGMFDATSGLRNHGTAPGAVPLLRSNLDPYSLDASAVGVTGGLNAQTVTLYHQPLIQIKLRVVEVVRNDGLQVNSVLEYVSRDNVVQSLTTGTPLNNGFENFRGGSNFDIEGLIENLTTGSGGLINLTSEHINWAVAFLASEFNGDIITAPEVTTLNGQNVEFVSGDKIPFQLGQNVIQGTNNNIQQVFYKNVGTYVSVTPRIVNWGLNAEGRGEAAIVATEIQNWNQLISSMLDSQIMQVSDTLRSEIAPYANNDRVVPFAVKQNILNDLNNYRKSQLIVYERDEHGQVIGLSSEALKGLNVPALMEGCGQCQTWRPEDCTIDLAVVVRLSDAGQQTISLTTNGDTAQISTNTESDVRAIANVIQLKSGEGVVMAGLIGESDQEVAQKIPVLGDIPYIGAAFRSKSTSRQKTEVLIFMEAKVLDRRPEVAKAQTVEDFQLGRAYVEGRLLDNPLECGMYRAGFGTYLPPIRKGEEHYWKRYNRKLRKIATHIDDIKE